MLDTRYPALREEGPGGNGKVCGQATSSVHIKHRPGRRPAAGDRVRQLAIEFRRTRDVAIELGDGSIATYPCSPSGQGWQLFDVSRDTSSLFVRVLGLGGPRMFSKGRAER